MDIFIRSIFTSSLLILLLSGYFSYGQDSSRKLYFGLDVSKNIPAWVDPDKYFFQESRIIEPSVWIPFNNGKSFLSLTPGYSSIRANPIYKNLDYYNQGVYLKTGIEFIIEKSFTFGTSVTTSVYDEFGNYSFEGPYFGDVAVPFGPRRLTVFSGEFHVAPRISVADRFFINFVFRSCFHTLNIARHQRPESYYVPGIGATSRDKINFTGGLSINLQYAISLK